MVQFLYFAFFTFAAYSISSEFLFLIKVLNFVISVLEF